MLRSTHRFHGYGSLKKVYAAGRSVRGGQIGLKYATKDTSKPYRVAVVVSKKVHKSAVARNRVRRRLYEAIRALDPQPNPGTDMIFTVFSDQLKDMPSQKLQKAVTELSKKPIKNSRPALIFTATSKSLKTHANIGGTWYS